VLLFFFFSVFGRETNNGLCDDVYTIHTLYTCNAQKRFSLREEGEKRKSNFYAKNLGFSKKNVGSKKFSSYLHLSVKKSKNGEKFDLCV